MGLDVVLVLKNGQIPQKIQRSQSSCPVGEAYWFVSETVGRYKWHKLSMCSTTVTVHIYRDEGYSILSNSLIYPHNLDFKCSSVTRYNSLSNMLYILYWIIDYFLKCGTLMIFCIISGLMSWLICFADHTVQVSVCFRYYISPILAVCIFNVGNAESNWYVSE
jgi:hypothetical protein